MHEAAIAQSIVKTVLAEAEKQAADKVESIEIEVGELTFLGTDQVKFWLDTSFQNTIAEGAEIIFTRIKAELHCDDCGFDGKLKVEEDPAYHMNLPTFSCPECQSTRIKITRGKEALIRRIKILKN